MHLLQQTCDIKNKITRADWPEPFLKHQEDCPFKVPETDYPEYIKATADRTRTQQAYIGMLERGLWAIEEGIRIFQHSLCKGLASQ